MPEITLDLSPMLEWIDRGPFYFALQLFLAGGWIALVILILVAGFWGWTNYIRARFLSQVKYTLLAVDIPRENEQTPKAVESIFAVVASADSERPKVFYEKYWDGTCTLSFSFEIVSLEGYTQYLVRTPAKYRDLIEAAIYAQYPDAEITEVEDYTKAFSPSTILDHHDLWGTDLVLTSDDAYPIRTYPFFEHTLSQKLVDPMAALLETMSSMGKGEQLWFQILITPIEDTWKKKSQKLAQKLIGAKAREVKGVGEHVLDAVGGLGQEVATQVGVRPPAALPTKQAEQLRSQVLYLSPGERSIVEAVETKLTKIGFKTNMRMIYLAPKETINKGKGVAGLMGALRQVTSQDSNRLKLDKWTRTITYYLFAGMRLRYRKRRILSYYQQRAQNGSEFKTTRTRAFVLNTEELATLWHFPMKEVKAPLVKMTGTKKTAPPSNLPEERQFASLREAPRRGAERALTPSPPPQAPPPSRPPAGEAPRGVAPENLPVIE